LLVYQVYRSSVSMLNIVSIRMDLVLEFLHSAANCLVHIGRVLDTRSMSSGNECKRRLGRQLTRCDGVPVSCVSSNP